MALPYRFDWFVNWCHTGLHTVMETVRGFQSPILTFASVTLFLNAYRLPFVLPNWRVSPQKPKLRTPIDVRLLVVLALALVALGLFWHVGMLRDGWAGNRGLCFMESQSRCERYFGFDERVVNHWVKLQGVYIPSIITKFSFRVWRLCRAVLIGIVTCLLHNGIDSKDGSRILCLCDIFWASSNQRLCIWQESPWGDPSQHNLGVQFSVPKFQISSCIRDEVSSSPQEAAIEGCQGFGCSEDDCLKVVMFRFRCRWESTKLGKSEIDMNTEYCISCRPDE